MTIGVRLAERSEVPLTPLQRLPVILFVSGGVVSLASMFMEWAVIHPGWADQVGPLHGYQKDVLAFFALFLLAFTIRLTARSWYGAAARTMAVFTLLVAMTGQFAAYLDVVAIARFLHDVPRFLPGYYVGWASLALYAAATVAAFLIPEE